MLYTLREKCPNTEFFSGPYFPVFGLNTGKYGPEKTSYFNTFYAVIFNGIIQRFVIIVIQIISSPV